MNQKVMAFIFLILIFLMPTQIIADESLRIANHSFALITDYKELEPDQPAKHRDNKYEKHHKNIKTIVASMYIRNDDCIGHYKAMVGETILGEGQIDVNAFPQIISLGESQVKITCIPQKVMHVFVQKK